jgi:hypothetical protein
MGESKHEPWVVAFRSTLLFDHLCMDGESTGESNSDLKEVIFFILLLDNMFCVCSGVSMRVSFYYT